MPADITTMTKISSGVQGLDSLIGSLHIGDNVVWEVDAGASYEAFIRDFISRSFKDEQKVIYVSFNRSPQSVLAALTGIISPVHFIFIDCFTSGKGKNDNTFLRFYDKQSDVKTVRITDPKNIKRFTQTLNEIEDSLHPGARYVFDSLTGMQDLWGDENETHRFFTYMCPRLYDLNTVAYWILEKEAHSPKFKANLRHITQVVLDLQRRKSSLYLKALKLEGRQDREAFKSHAYEVRDDHVCLIPARKEPVADIGAKIKEARTRTGMSQKDLADKVGITPSSLSQIEANLTSPSLSTFFHICRSLDIQPGLFVESGAPVATPWLHRKTSVLSSDPSMEGKARTYSIASGRKLAAQLVVLPSGVDIKGHFSYHRGDEFIYVVEGTLVVTVEGREERIAAGDALCFTESFPSAWKNEGGGEAQVLVVRE
ncbi:MAG: hypothetical protein A2X56_00775 [Nitrospirae bacterium GWC2_57_13]|jgi:transcriptional regulator with XRE-family HTH domain|nr:MAG: hypothetical protein A2X56_00775 [Nitrospirae bacterium GWC2_57_13]OGW43409.1 MAG: hypothetical protein A2X57_10915 [Nitrospirae bacterium GWD2_57_8]